MRTGDLEELNEEKGGLGDKLRSLLSFLDSSMSNTKSNF